MSEKITLRNPLLPRLAVPENSVFTREDADLIVRLAQGLSQEEVQQAIGLLDIGVLPEDDQELFVWLCTVPKLQGVTTATDSLFKQMPNSLQAALAYLYKYGSEWNEGDGKKSKPVTLEITLSK